MVRSLVWEHFIVDCSDERFTNCKHCQKRVARGGNIKVNFSTTPLRDHLKASHNKEFQAMIKEEKGSNNLAFL